MMKGNEIHLTMSREFLCRIQHWLSVEATSRELFWGRSGIFDSFLYNCYILTSSNDSFRYLMYCTWKVESLPPNRYRRGKLIHWLNSHRCIYAEYTWNVHTVDDANLQLDILILSSLKAFVLLSLSRWSMPCYTLRTPSKTCIVMK